MIDHYSATVSHCTLIQSNCTAVAAMVSPSVPVVFTVCLANNVACVAYDLFTPPEVFPVRRLTGHQHKEAGEPV